METDKFEVGLKKALQSVKDNQIREQLQNIVRDHTRNAYMKRLQKCGVILR